MAQDQVVTVEYNRLTNPYADLSKEIAQGYGPDGLGIVTVSGVPGYEELREQLLPLAECFAALPDATKQLYEDPDSNWSFGWSHGREMLSSGRPDTHKGSYYANPTVDVPRVPSMEATAQYRSYYRPNIWPRQHLPELEAAFKALGRLVVDAGLLLAEHCERYVNKELGCSNRGGHASTSTPCTPTSRYSSSSSRRPHPSSRDDNKSPRPQTPSGQGQLLSASLRSSQCHKARLLHYFPNAEAAEQGHEGPQDSWCGWHRDHGALTGLTSAMYLCNGTQVPCPDPSAGLYIQTRAGSVVQARIPPSHLAFQLGQVMAIQSGGLLCATPHCVRGACGPAAAGVSRNTFAVFMQPEVTQQLRAPAGKQDAVLQLDQGQWRPGQSFGDFAEVTMKGYYRDQGRRLPMRLYLEHD